MIRPSTCIEIEQGNTLPRDAEPLIEEFIRSVGKPTANGGWRLKRCIAVPGRRARHSCPMMTAKGNAAARRPIVKEADDAMRIENTRVVGEHTGIFIVDIILVSPADSAEITPEALKEAERMVKAVVVPAAREILPHLWAADVEVTYFERTERTPDDGDDDEEDDGTV